MFSLLVFLPSLFIESIALGATASPVTAQEICRQTLSESASFEPTLLYRDTSPIGTNPFIHSNEFDWFTAAIDTSKADLVMGVGTNNVWDIAVRKDANDMIIADLHEDPLKAQEFLLAPLVLEATSPQEFISFLAGVELPANMHDKDIAEVFDYLERQLGSVFDPAIDQQMLEKVVSRLEKNPKISTEQIRFVTLYYRDLSLVREKIPRMGLRRALEGDTFAGFKHDMATQEGMFFFVDFYRRYNPESLIENGADPNVVRREAYST